MMFKFLQNALWKKKQSVNRMKFHAAELQKLIADKKSGKISSEEFASKYKMIEQQWS